MKHAVVAVLLACSLVLAAADSPTPAAAKARPADAKDKAIDPAIEAAAGAAGAVAGLPLSMASNGAISPGGAASVIANKVVAADSAGKALSNAGGVIGALLGTDTSNLHTAGVLAGKTIVEFVRALTSLRIAGGQLAASGANSALQGLVGNIRNSALSIGNTYTELLGELGRSVGAGANLGLGFLTSGAGRALNPLQLGLDALNFELNNLVSFLQGAVDITTAANPAAGAVVTPFIGVLRAVQAVLNTLAQVLMGPPSNPGQLIQGLAAATGNVLGVPGDAAAGVASNPISNTLNLINTAQGLLGKLLKP